MKGSFDRVEYLAIRFTIAFGGNFLGVD